MSIYHHSSGNSIKYQNISPNNLSASDAERYSLRSFYESKFSSSAIMASFANNYHNHHYQQQQIGQHQQFQHHALSRNYDSFYPSSYPQSSHYNPYSYQPLTPPSHQEDSRSYNEQVEDNSSNESVCFKTEKSQKCLYGKLFQILLVCDLGYRFKMLKSRIHRTFKNICIYR